ncbi:MAG: MFS transporter, partial [Hyphomicrobiales bacterium]|nr:MFS transporter [Hyphomicrobiales bacterium]
VAVIAACLLVVGAGTALHHAPSSSLIANSYKLGRRSGALGIYNASGDVGKLVFTGCFSLATGAGFAWYQISLVYGLIALAAAIVIGVVTQSFLRQPGLNKQDETEACDQAASNGWGILNWRSFGALLTVTSIDTVVQTAIFVFVAFLMLSKGLPLPIATGATVLLLAGGVFGKAGCGFLADRMGARQAFILIQALTAIGLVGIVSAPNWLALFLLVPLGAVAQGSTSITYGFAANLIHPKRMARGYALLYSSGTLASVAGPLVFGWIADTLGIGNAVYFMALFVLSSIPPMLMLRIESA